MAAILITGAGRGIGRSLVDVFAERGDTVFALARKPWSQAAAGGSAVGNITPIQGDVSSDACKQAIVSVLEANQVRSLDVLINNAGIGGVGKSLAAVESEEMLELFQTNCLGALRCTQACLPYLLAAPRPLVVNISSRLGSLAWNASQGSVAAGHSYAYRVSKAALNMLGICMALELEPSGLRVVAINPGTARTDLGSPQAESSPREAAEALVKQITSSQLDPYHFSGPHGAMLPW